jgi:hypothetical protein
MLTVRQFSISSTTVRLFPVKRLVGEREIDEERPCATRKDSSKVLRAREATRGNQTRLSFTCSAAGPRRPDGA